MPKETMTPKERWLAVAGRQKPDRVPMDYWGTDETSALLRKHLGCRTTRQALAKLQVDYVVRVHPEYRGPRLPRRTDVFGREHASLGYGTGSYDECVHHPLAAYRSVGEIDRHYQWPNPDWWDYNVLRGQIRGREMYPIRGGGSEPFLIYKDLRGQEQAFVDLVEHPEMVHYCLGRLFDLAYEDTVRTYERIPGKVTLTYVAEDMGGQNDLMISLDHIREFLLPGMKRMIDLVHQAGAIVFHHNDGNCRRVVPDMVEAGIDILNPIQWWNTGMDRAELKQKFGSKVVFHGAMDNQNTLPFGRPEDVRREARENLDILGKGGGYILAPCHNIQPITPVENIIAMYEAGYEFGWT
ncbi:MAG: uroporphyrinogen decarboxylase family protein [Candidatus Aminicenantales bacterium]